MTHAAKIAKPVAEMSEDEFDAWMEALPPPPGIKHVDDDDEDADAEDDASAMADLAAGRCHDHAVVGQWLQTWGMPDWKPFKDWLAEQDG
jgi:acyl-CoA synthetase (NDP forming)